jgi:hypothetical protein
MTGKDDGLKHPRDGDLSMCINCGQLSVFVARAKGGLRKPSKFETNEFITDPTVIKMVGLWAMNRVIIGEAPAESLAERREQAINALIYAADAISNHLQVCPACLIMVAADSIEERDELHFKSRHESEAMH